MRFRCTLVRFGGAVTAASSLALSVPVSAFAADVPLTVLGLQVGSMVETVMRSDVSGKPRKLPAGLLVLRVHEGSAHKDYGYYSYCVDIDRALIENAGMTDADWKQYPKEHAGFVPRRGRSPRSWGAATPTCRWWS